MTIHQQESNNPTGKALPLVSCIMPTYNRRRFIPNATRYFLRQDYPNKELIIVDDGTDGVADLVPDHHQIKYFRTKKFKTLGEKRNYCVQLSQGELIMHWDDDDWYAADRIRYQVNALMHGRLSVCGINKLIYYDIDRQKGFLYTYPQGLQPWLLGSSLCYKKALWQQNTFAQIDVGMDGLFVRNTPIEEIEILRENRFSVHTIHATNISPKRTDGLLWRPYPVEEIKSLIGAEWSGYSSPENGTIARKGSMMSPTSIELPGRPPKILNNVFACLVHEKEECVIDLVRNLHYFEPNSKIILYDGSADQDLFQSKFPYHLFNAVIHPHSKPQRHGYLHGFAIDCIGYALKNDPFDILTIVDSDQLLLKKGYSEYLSDQLKRDDINKIGLLAKVDQPIPLTDTANYVAQRAMKEVKLWGPFLKRLKTDPHNLCIGPFGLPRFLPIRMQRLFWRFFKWISN